MKVLTEAGRDPLVPGGLVIPAAGFGIGLQSADVVELRANPKFPWRVDGLEC